jgi:type II secretory pathway component PulK
MRSVIVLLGLLMASTVAQTQTPSQDDIVRRTREALETAQTKEAVEGVKSWCVDSIRSLNFREHERLTLEAIKLMEDDKIEEANLQLRKINALKELADNLAEIVCRPN